MPRGKATVYAGNCETCNTRIGTFRVMKSKKADFRKLKKFCWVCTIPGNKHGSRQNIKLKEEKHSS